MHVRSGLITASFFVAATAFSQAAKAQTQYTIQPYTNSSVCLDITGASNAPGTHAESWTCNGGQNQQFALSSLGGSNYNLIPQNSGLCLDVSGASTSDSAPIIQWTCEGPTHTNQVWQMIPVGNYYQFVSINSSKCLDTGNTTGSGSTLIQWDCGLTNPNQLWKLNVVGAAAPPAVSQTGEQASQADGFVDSVGINIHLTFLDTNYFTQFPQLLKELTNLGVRHIRDGISNWPSYSPFIAEHNALGAAGLKTTYIVNVDPTLTPQIIHSVATQLGDAEALEAANECELGNNCGGGGSAGIGNVVAYLPTLQLFSATLGGLPVIGPSFTGTGAYLQAGNISSYINYNNLHTYFGARNPGTGGWGGADIQGNAYGSFAFQLDNANDDAPGVPIQMTETGYHMSTSQVGGQVSESVAAVYLPRTLLLSFNNGIKRTFLYEMLENQYEPGFGLIRSDMTERPAFVAIKNLLAILSDKGQVFTPGKLDYTLSGGDSTLNHALFQKRDGSFWLALWLEQPSINPDTAQPIAVASQTLSLTFNQGAHSVQVNQFDSSGAVSTAGTVMGRSTTVVVSDKLSIVKISQ